jgi:hypothetical protein
MRGRVQLHIFYMWIFSDPDPFVEKTVLSSQNDLGTLVENKLNIDESLSSPC